MNALLETDLASRLFRRAEEHPDRRALSVDGVSWSYSNVTQAALTAWALLKESDVRPGWRIGIHAEDPLVHFAAIYGVIAAGCTPIPLSPSQSPDTRSDALRFLGGDLLLSFDEGEVAEGSLGSSGIPELRIADGRTRLLGGSRTRSPTDFERPGEYGKPSDDAVILQSSGSTGRPKGIRLSHDCRFAYARTFASEFSLSAADRVLVATPISHNAAQMWVQSALLLGAEVVFGAVDALSDPTITKTFIVPAQLVRLAEADVFGRTSQIVVVTGAAPVPLELKHEVHQSFRHLALYEAYGLTELGVLTVLTPTDFEQKPGSIGRPVASVRLALMDPTSVSLSDRAGELLARSPCAMSGYIGAEARSIDVGGLPFLATGDLVERDNDGFFYHRGRIDNLLISGGVNVFAEEVEASLLRVPYVIDAFVMGVPHPYWGQEIVALVKSARSDSDFSTADLLATCRKYLDAAKCPKRVFIVDEIRRNHMGKLDRAAMADAGMKLAVTADVQGEQI